MGIINVNSKDTITSINGKTGVISKADLAAMDIPIDMLTNKPDNYRNGLSLPSSYPVGHTMFVSAVQTDKFNNIDYCVIVTIRGYASSGVPTTQYLYPQTTHGPIYIRTAITGSDSWSSWKSLATTEDIPTSLPANGGNAATVNGKTVAVNVPAGANFNDTVTTINGKTGAISKADIVALGIPAQDTVYTHPTSHPASQVTAGALPVGVTATNSTDYTTSRVRNIRFGTTVPTSLANGETYFMYE